MLLNQYGKVEQIYFLQPLPFHFSIIPSAFSYIPFVDRVLCVCTFGIFPIAQSVEIKIDTMSIPHTKRSSGFPIDSVHVPDMYNLVCDGVGMYK